MRLWFVLVAVACLWLLGCGKEGSATTTRVVFRVDASLALTQKLDRVTLEDLVSSRRASLWLKNAPSGTEKRALPLLFEVRKGKAPSASVAITGYAGEVALVERRVELTFDEGKIRVLSVFLSEACSDVRCGSAQTCGDCGTCVEREVDTRNLPEVAESAEALELGMPPRCDPSDVDASPFDSGQGEEAGPRQDPDGGSSGSEAGVEAGVNALSIKAPLAVAKAGCYAIEISQVGQAELTLRATGASLFSDATCTVSVQSGTTSNETEGTLYLSMTPPTAAGEPNVRLVTLELEAEGQTASHVIEVRKPAKHLLRGTTHTCVQLVDDTMQCMGATAFGMTGVTNPPRAMVARPTKAPNLTGSFSVLRGRATHGCGIVDGGARCWGQDSWGQLGDGGDFSYNGSPQPVTVAGLTSQVTQIETSGEHACAVANGQAYCWGRNDDGRIEASAIDGFESPRLRSDLGATVLDVATSGNSSCALTSDSSAKCWRNEGETQSALSTRSFAPAQATLLEGSSTGFCALTDQGVYCFGESLYGELGFVGTQVNPQKVNLSGAVNGSLVGLTVANAQSCAFTASDLYCWGSNPDGRLGTGSSSSSPARVPLPAGEISDVASGGNTVRNATCAIVDGLVYCWGFHLYGELGFSEQAGDLLTPVLSPTLTELDPNQVFLSRWSHNGDGVSAALKSGATYLWGSALLAQLGDLDERLGIIAPSLVPALSNAAQQVGFGVGWALARAEGKAYTWGTGYTGSLGAGSVIDRRVPGVVDFGASGKTVLDVAAGHNHACAVVRDAATPTQAGVYCWGRRARGEVGDGVVGGEPRTTPVAVVAESSAATDVTASFEDTCAVVDGGLLCWGGFNGQSVPTAVAGLTSGVESAELSEDEVCVLTSAQTVKCVQRETNTVIPLTLGGAVAELKAGVRHMCARRMDGALYCWGKNESGQLGNGDRVDHIDDPVLVQGLTGAVSAFSLGYELGMSCARDAEGWKCWGNNGLHGMGLLPYTQTSPALMLGWEN